MRIVFLLLVMLASVFGEAATKTKPLMEDFMGLNGHFQFKPELHKQVSRLVRNYHNIKWDVKG